MNCRREIHGLAAGVALALTSTTTTADMIDGIAHQYFVTATDFAGVPVAVFVQDVYVLSDDPSDMLLNLYNANLPETAAASYFQSLTGAGWLSNNLGSIFDTPALRLADSFVTIGGFAQDTLLPEQAPNAGSGTGLDPNFGGNNAAAPGVDAGWFNSSPPSLNGQVGQVADGSGGFGLGVLIGRFAFDGDFSLEGSTLEVTWNQGLGTDGSQQAFTVTPAPGAMALLGLAGLAGRRRRG